MTITRDGKPVATLVAVEDEPQADAAQKVNLVDYLKSFPEPGLVLERNPSPSRDVDL